MRVLRGRGVVVVARGPADVTLSLQKRARLLHQLGVLASDVPPRLHQVLQPGRVEVEQTVQVDRDHRVAITITITTFLNIFLNF